MLIELLGGAKPPLMWWFAVEVLTVAALINFKLMVETELEGETGRDKAAEHSLTVFLVGQY